MDKSLAFIPARSGSKRVQNKNIKKLSGKTLIEIAIRNAFDANFDRVVVASDDLDYLALAESAGAETFLRRRFADDFSPVRDSVIDFINSSNLDGVTGLALLLPSSVLFDSSILMNALTILKNNEVDFVVPVFRSPQPVERSFYLDDGCMVFNLDKRAMLRRTQDFTPRFFDAGCFSLGSVDSWKEHSISFASRCYGIELDTLDFCDIDTLDDLRLCEALLASGAVLPTWT